MRTRFQPLTRRGPLWLGVVLLLGLAAAPASGSSIVPPRDLGELASASDAVVLARAAGSSPGMRGQAIVTHTTFEILDVVHGPLRLGEALTVETLGGTLNTRGLTIAGNPDFEPGAVYLLFLSATDDGAWQPRMLSYGLLRRTEDTDGAPLLTHLDAIHDLELVRRPDGLAAEPIGTYYEAALLPHLRQVTTARADWDARRVAVPAEKLPVFLLEHTGSAGKANSIPQPCVYFMSSGRPARWNTPGDSTPITYYAAANGDQDITDGFEFTAVQTGIAQWGGIADIDLSWSYGGPRAYTPGCAAGEGAIDTFPDDLELREGLIQFNDPCNEIPDLAACSGVLAYGGTYHSTDAPSIHTHREGDWNTNLVGFVVVNNGVGACLNRNGYQAMMTHELGHSLGFGHIPTGSGLANMNPSCCNQITTIDQTCALYAYSEIDVTAAMPPAPITLSSPADNATGLTANVTLAWFADAHASSYHLQVAQDPNFTTLIASEAGLTTTTREIGSLPSGEMFYWRVRGMNAAGNGAWSTTYRFTTTLVLPGVVALSAPAQAATLNPASVAFAWQPEQNAATYQLQVGIDAVFSGMLFNEIALTETSRTLGPFETGRTYHWRVRAINGAGEGPWSQTRRFSTTPTLPGAVTLSKPNDQATTPAESVTFAWNAVTGTDTYRLQIATDAGFNDVTADLPGLTGTTQTLNPFAPETPHFWRVRAVNGAGEGPWSLVRRFTTLPNVPTAIPLISPTDHASDAPSTITFAWQDDANIDAYHLQIATDAGFTALMHDESGLTAATRTVGPLAYSTTHYWRVRGTNAAGTGPWSTPGRFTVSVGTAVERAGDDVPARFALHANYPNPFNPTTTVAFDLPEGATVRLVVYDVQGRAVATLVAGALPPGRFTAAWDASHLPSGAYLLRLEAGAFTQTRTALLLK